MANWAIVIGIDRYWTERACLKGAVADALRMREWLLDPAGGNVPEKNTALILSPLAGKEPAGLDAVDATNSQIIIAIDELLKRSKGKGERLYFFYAGHGLTARINQRDENALVANDFSPVTTNNSLALRSLWEFFETTQFEDQYLFVDACRNIPWDDVEFEVGRWPVPRKRDPGLPPTQQFILYATSPGLKARELQEAGNERGAFTEVLLEGLRGAGPAKAWCPGAQNYQVPWERLVNYVKAELERRRLAVGAGVAQEVFQIPQDSGARGVAGRDRNPVLAEFESGAFPAQTLKVDLKPSAAVPVAEVIVLDESAVPVDTKAQITGTPIEFSLPPRTYSLHATAPEYDRAVARPPVDLYEEREIPLKLAKAAPASPPAAPMNGSSAARAVEEAATGELHVRCSDPLAPVEIADSVGRVVALANGEVTRKLPAGFYRARLRLPGAELVEQLVELTPGGSPKVELGPPAAPSSRATREVLEAIGGDVRPDNTIEVPEAGGPLASAHLATLLTLAGGASTHDADESSKLRRLGLKAFKKAIPPDADSGLYILVGIDSEDPKEAKRLLNGLALRTWTSEQQVPKSASRLLAVPRLTGIAEFAIPTAVGSGWLSVEAADDEPVVFALAQLPGRFTMLTLVLEANQARAFQYMPSLSPDDSADPRELRRLELMQRLLLGGSLEAGNDLALELLQAKNVDPLAACLSAYIFLRQGRVDELRTAIGNLLRAYPEMSDGLVLKGELEAAAGRHADAKRAFAKAIEVGIPLFGEGLTRLLEGLRTYKLEHPRANLVETVFKRHVSGSMWSVWRPEQLKPGRKLLK
jgi:Caspase domain